MKMMLTGVRLAFPEIFNPKAFSGSDDASYSALLIMDPKTQGELVKQVNQAVLAVAKEKWGAKGEAMVKQLTAKGNTCFRDGADKPEYDGFEGMQYISARSKTRPLVLGIDKTPLTEEDGKPYAGCYVNCSVEIWAMDNSYGKRVCASLKGLQFVKDGDAFGGGAPASADEFDEIEAVDGDVDDMFD